MSTLQKADQSAGTATALAGVRVLDLSRVLAGPWATQMLADLGADVLKIEQPGGGDDTRRWGPPFLTRADGSVEEETSAYYCAANRNKRSLAVDLATAEGADLIRRLAREADVLVENFKRGGLARFGLDPARLRRANPRLVSCSITGFGQTGPYADRPGYDFVAQAMGGFMSITGEEGGGPLRAGVAIADLFTGCYAATAILAALRHAEATGEGQEIDLSLLDTQAAVLANQAMNWLVGGVVPGRTGNRHPTIVPYTTFAVADGTVVIAVGNDRQFAILMELLGRPELARDPRFTRGPDRLTHRDAIEAEIAQLVAEEQGAALIERLTAAGIPAGPVNSIDALFADPVIEARDMLHRFEREDGTELPSVAFPPKLSGTPARMMRPPPRIGEGGTEALAEWLGMGESEIAALRRAGAIG